jgi:hypothetical protein
MVIKDLVSYDIAVKLKKLGFSEPCFGYYDCERDFKFIPNKLKFLECEVAVPTFSQVSCFFRKKYNLDNSIVIDHIKIKDVRNKKYHPYIFNNDEMRGKYLAFYDTYEEAELACLHELIELATKIQPKKWWQMW